MSNTAADALEAYRGQRFVVKLGGEVLQNQPGLDALSADIALLSQRGVRLVMVHGGGPQADALAQKLGHKVRKVAGRRITDDDALEVAKMVYAGSTNVDLLGALRRNGALGVGLSGVDGDLLTVRRRPSVRVSDPETGTEEWINFGHVGDIEAVDTHLLELLLERGYVPVVASIAADSEGNIYNVNADTIAQALAVALQANALYLLTNVPGVLLDRNDPQSLLPICTPERTRELIQMGVISGGMLPKVQNCLEAIAAGVKRVRVLDGSQPRSLLVESLLHPGIGTEFIAGE